MRILVFWMPKRTIRFAKTHVRIPQEKDLALEPKTFKRMAKRITIVGKFTRSSMDL